MRAQMALVPLQTLKLRDNLTMLYGPGKHGDAQWARRKGSGRFQLPERGAKLKQALDNFGPASLKTLINTHWHFDHTDGNAPMHAAGATIVAHENTRKRLSTPQDIRVFECISRPPQSRHGRR